MDHHSGVGATGSYSGLKNSFYYGQRPDSVYIPRFRNVNKTDQPYLRGFAFENWISKEDWTRGFYQTGMGADWKESLTKPGDWTAYFEAYGETLPDYNNKVTLSETKKDKWELPVLAIDMEYGENAKKMRVDMQQTAVDMLTASDLHSIQPFDNTTPGSTIHEMGTARMGHDPKTSVLNKWNQSHDISNLFVTDGSCMPSSPCQNPSLTYMALTARACDYAANALRKNGAL
jgi:choline dehydrogenase-like flavoprotein